MCYRTAGVKNPLRVFFTRKFAMTEYCIEAKSIAKKQEIMDNASKLGVNIKLVDDWGDGSFNVSVADEEDEDALAEFMERDYSEVDYYLV
jgi:hypothetical protein